MAAAGDEPETVEVTLRAVGPSRPTTLRLPPLLSVAELRRRVSRDRRLSATEEVRLHLVLRGRTLPHQDDAHVSLRDGDTLIVAVAPKPPAKHLRDDDDEEEEEEELILGTGFLIILLNLGRRQQGDVSAYSIFNEDFRELPGTLNADRIDRDIRAGQF
nr:unnamed protein product [Digitaria exilis]